ncbi:MAG: carboxylesterase/lipase family protein [Candidatus Lokiarchaeota archaeon]|nr:carboxylesterase/lipase family protein [Candidatus Lokiarchaeota archaeon]
MEIIAIIDTKSGKVQGYSDNGIEVYKGIPFAEPPIGDLRFQPPIAKAPWDGVLDATKYGPCSFQGATQLEEWFGKLEPESEDCLTLNIWTPAADGDKRPVMFWIHGGAFIMGGGTHEFYDGLNLAKRGNVVVVTINYRLGALGFLYIPDKTINAGILDQALALNWVHNNIKKFGGDPDNITIFGESAGGYSVLTLPVIPQVKGQIRRVIAQSAPAIDPEISDKNTKGFMRKLKVKKGDIESLRNIPPEEIIKAQNEFMGSDPNNILAFRPLIDGDTIPKHPLNAFRDGDLKDIDFLIGTNLDEAKLFTYLDPGFNEMVKTGGENAVLGLLAMSGVDPNESKEILETYKSARKGKLSIKPMDLLDAVVTDAMFRIPTIRFLEAHSKYQPNTFNYMFTFPCPQFDGALGCPHAIDIPFVFNTLNAPGIPEFVGNGPDINNLSEKVMDAWIAFAHTGNPNHKNLPEWSPYDTKTRTTMMLGEEIKVSNKVFDKEREAWEGLLEI